MDSHGTEERLSLLIRERAAVDFGIDDPDLSSLVEFLVEDCQLAPERASALVWAEPLELDPDELDALAETFSLHRDLLACFTQPSSAEMIEHVLFQVGETSLNFGECPVCEDIGERIADCFQLDFDELRDLAFEALAHMTMTIEIPFGDEEPPLLPTEPVAGAPLPAPASDLERVIAALDPNARLRVLAYAYQELAATTDGRQAAGFAAYARLRSDHLTPLARRALDVLAGSERGEMDSRELAEMLGLRDGRALGQLPRSVERSLAELGELGYSLDCEPLVVRRAGGATVLALAGPALRAWRALLRAEHSPRPAQQEA